MDANMSVPIAALPTEEPALYEGRISRTVLEALFGVFYGLAIVVASIRLILQARVNRRLYLDDYILIFACISLTAGTVLGYANVGNLYWSEGLNYNPTHIYYLLEEHVDVAAHIDVYEGLGFSYPTLLWITIFAIKLAYLVFLRRLIDRVLPLIMYWRIVLGVTIVSFLVCVVSMYLGCMKRGLKAAICLQPVYVHRTLDLAILNIVLDISTDLMLVAIPIRLLWSVRIRPYQKGIIGVFLSLNLFMVITASIRISGFNFRGKYDFIWFSLWQELEGCVAVSMFSLTAFRSVFVALESSRARREGAKKPWYSSTVAAIKRNKARQPSDEEAIQELPRIPSATLTGMRTFIQGGRHKRASRQTTGFTSTYGGEPDEWPLYDSRPDAEGNKR